MLRALSLLALHLLLAVEASSAKLKTCPLLGQQYPVPVQLSAEPEFKLLTKSLNAQINKTLGVFPFNTTTFSVGIFSTAEEDLIYQYHYTDALLSKQKSNSSRGYRVNADSIYQMGSVSKLLTIYLWLLKEGDRHFNFPLTEYIPELLNVQDNWNSLTPEWSDITIGDLAGQMGGLARDFGLADIAPPASAALPLPKALLAALPKLPSNEVPKCGYLVANGSLVVCSEDEYIQGVATESPIFPTAYTPVYSNEAFALLGIALANAGGDTLAAIFNDSLVEPLGLKGTYSSAPKPSIHDVIPGNPLESGWNAKFGIFAAAGGYFSSTNDFATIGRSILTSRLLSKSVTGRWLKPTSFVESFDQGVGRPWEIFRRKVNGQSIDLYTKAGDWGYYHSFFAVIPAYNVGLSVLTAEDPPGVGGGTVRQVLPEPIIDALLPTLDSIAKSQAATNFAGEYVSSQTNSTLKVEVASSGLEVKQWIYNGVSILDAGFRALIPDLVWNIVPNQLYTGNKVGFTSYYQAPAAPPTNETWYLSCAGWIDVDEAVFGNIPLGNMVFEVDGSGKATSVEVRALRTTLKRKS